MRSLKLKFVSGRNIEKDIHRKEDTYKFKIKNKIKKNKQK